ncbi:MAG: Fe-S cluster assembly protein SufD [candidate division FCPU426 bacterium]
MIASPALKTLKGFFSKASVERCSAAFGDPEWLRAERLKAWEFFDKNGLDGAFSGARWLAEVKNAGAWALDPGEKLAFPAAFSPGLQEGDWGELSGSRAFGCEEDFGATLLDEEAKSAGVVWCSLKEALRSHPELLRKHLFSRTAAQETSFAALNAAYFGQGTFLYVPKNVRLTKPLRSVGLHTGGHAGFFPRMLAIIGQGSEVTLLDEIHSAGSAPGFCSAVSELVLEQGAHLNSISFQDLNTASGAVSRQSTVLSRDARLYTLAIVTGAAWSSSALGSRLEGEGAQLDLLGLLLGNGSQKIEIRTLQDHVGRSGQSDALVKSILRGKARSYFDGVVKIYKSGQNSNAFQSNPNLLLSSEAKAESVPTLEIEADDVACKHAASIGSIDEDEKFYLLSRGVPLRETEAMIVEGFAAELARRLPNASLQERFVQILSNLAARS